MAKGGVDREVVRPDVAEHAKLDEGELGLEEDVVERPAQQRPVRVVGGIKTAPDARVEQAADLLEQPRRARPSHVVEVARHQHVLAVLLQRRRRVADVGRLVDAALRQINELGWMHNRCRMIVASFLTKDLLINPQLGEEYFDQRLIDGDLSANNGGWQWSASSGMDPKPVRIFNPASQAQKFDPEGEYIREWLPELRSVDTEFLISGNIPADEREALGYPLPIVDHKIQQRLFKERYQQQKG